MFYVQNWNSMFPANNALEIFQHQLIGIKKSIQHYDSSSEIKKDSYILSELSKIKKLTYIIQNHLANLSVNPKDSEAADFLFSGEIKKLSLLQDGLKVFDLLEKAVLSRVEKVDVKFKELSSQVKDRSFKHLLAKIEDFSKDEESIYGSRCGRNALKIIDVFSKYIHPDQLKDFKDLEKLESMASDNVEVLHRFNKGIEKLRLEIAKDLRSGKHKLYYCAFENGRFKQSGGWSHPNYPGHSFVIEKTPDDKFRLYQSYVNHFSLKSYVTHQMEKYDDALLSYTEFYPFLKNLQAMDGASEWSMDFNEMYRSAFGVDHKDFLGETIDQNSFKLSYMSVDVLEKEYESEVSEEKLDVAKEISEKLKLILDDGKYLGIGASIGAVTALAGTVSVFAVRSILGF